MARVLHLGHVTIFLAGLALCLNTSSTSFRFFLEPDPNNKPMSKPPIDNLNIVKVQLGTLAELYIQNCLKSMPIGIEADIYRDLKRA